VGGSCLRAGHFLQDSSCRALNGDDDGDDNDDDDGDDDDGDDNDGDDNDDDDDDDNGDGDDDDDVYLIMIHSYNRYYLSVLRMTSPICLSL
jgi:hypothetical protein